MHLQHLVMKELGRSRVSVAAYQPSRLPAYLTYLRYL